MKWLEAQHPDLMQLRVVGQSAEGRRLYLATITSKAFRHGSTTKKEEPTEEESNRENRRMPINKVVEVNPLLRNILAEQAAHSNAGNTVSSKPVIFVDGGKSLKYYNAETLHKSFENKFLISMLNINVSR